MSTQRIDLGANISLANHRASDGRRGSLIAQWSIMRKRNVVVGLFLIHLLAACLPFARGQSIPRGGITVELSQFGDVNFGPSAFLNIPSDMASLGDGSGRIAISQIGGDVRLVNAQGQFIDGGSYFDEPRTGGFGSLSIVAHPNFAENGLIYQLVDKSTSGAPAPDFGSGGSHHNVLYEWTADDPASNNPVFTQRELLRVAQPDSEHNVFDIDFGPDGFLYVTSGDGGPATANPDARPRQLSQDMTSIYGKVLRIDPLNTSGPGLITAANGQYGIPSDNLGYDGDVGSGTLDEIWALGLRSPFRANFDDATGRLYVGDVGERYFEEINLVEAGRNYGWGRYEGELSRGSIPLAPESPVHTPPAFAYERDNAPYDPVTGGPLGSDPGDGDTVIGGFVYRGTEIPDLLGRYVFADFGRQRGPDQDGSPARLFYADLDATGDIIDSSVREFGIDADGIPLVVPTSDTGEVNGRTNSFIYSIGEDANRELYLMFGDDANRAVDNAARIVRLSAGNFAVPDLLGDLDFDGDIDSDDWELYRSGLDVDLTGLTTLLQYQSGDLDFDMDNDGEDFALFKDAFNSANGAGSLEALIGGVPEPGTSSIAAGGLLVLLSLRRGSDCSNSRGRIAE